MVKRALSDEQEQALAQDYRNGDGQTILARRYGVGQVTVRAALRRQGVQQRTLAATHEPKADPSEMLRLHFDERLNAKRIAARLGVHPVTVVKFLHRAGVELLPNAKYGFDRAFFDEVTPVTAYWAGFIAADGSINKNTVAVALAAADREVLARLKVAAQLEQPIAAWSNRIEGRDRDYPHVDLRVTSREWVMALDVNFNLRRGPGGKAVTLQPPKFDGQLAGHYIRGFFDGDGSASRTGCVTFTSASEDMLQWLMTMLGCPSKITAHRYVIKDGTNRCVRSLWYYLRDGDARRVARLIYAGSTSETRMERKYARLKHHLVSES